MNDNDRRRYEMLVRVNQFGTENAADFTGVATAKFTQLAANVNLIESSAADQLAGFGEAAQQFEVKDTIRENLREILAAIARTARSMEYEFDGVADKFRFNRSLSDANLLAKARAVISDIADYEADFIAYGMPAAFVANLENAADAFEASFSATASATAEHVAATAQTAANIRAGMILVRTLDAIVKNRYAESPGKLAAWTSAKHVEKAPKKKDPPPTP